MPSKKKRAGDRTKNASVCSQVREYGKQLFYFNQLIVKMKFMKNIVPNEVIKMSTFKNNLADPARTLQVYCVVQTAYSVHCANRITPCHDVRLITRVHTDLRLFVSVACIPAATVLLRWGIALVENSIEI